MITAEDYAALTGQEAPEDFAVLLLPAEELLHARTLQQYRREDVPNVPRTVFKRALASQITFMASRGLDGWADPAVATANVTLGRFSVYNAASSAKAAQSADAQLIAPGAQALLPTLMAYARAWMGGGCP